MLRPACLRAAVAALAAAALALAGCSTVHVRSPLSKHPEPIDREELEGVWIVGDGGDAATCTVRFDTNGVGQVAWVDWDADAFQLERAEFVVTRGRRHNYIALREQVDGTFSGDYILVGYRVLSGGDLCLWSADGAAFEKAIAGGRIGGEVKKESFGKDLASTDVTLTNAAETVVSFLDAPGSGDLFQYLNPVVVRKLKGD